MKRQTYLFAILAFVCCAFLSCDEPYDDINRWARDDHRLSTLLVGTWRLERINDEPFEEDVKVRFSLDRSFDSRIATFYGDYDSDHALEDLFNGDWEIRHSHLILYHRFFSAVPTRFMIDRSTDRFFQISYIRNPRDHFYPFYVDNNVRRLSFYRVGF